jgi:hypothetical protein
VAAASLVGALVLAAVSSSNALAALYPQCPPVGDNLGCSQLITVSNSGPPVVTTDPAAPPLGYDGSEDTLIGVQNNSRRAVSHLNLASPTNIFGFDNDGLCAAFAWPSAPIVVPPGCPGLQGFGPTGYEGPGTSFSNISSNTLTGTVNFSPALQPGKSAYFGLEEALQNGQLRSSANGPVAGPIMVASGHVVIFQLTCVGRAACIGSVKIEIVINGNRITAVIARKHKKHRLTIGSTKISISSGATASIAIHLNKKGKQLAKHKRFKAGIVVVSGGHRYLIGTVKL